MPWLAILGKPKRMQIVTTKQAQHRGIPATMLSMDTPCADDQSRALNRTHYVFVVLRPHWIGSHKHHRGVS